MKATLTPTSTLRALSLFAAAWGSARENNNTGFPCAVFRVFSAGWVAVAREKVPPMELGTQDQIECNWEAAPWVGTQSLYSPPLRVKTITGQLSSGKPVYTSMISDFCCLFRWIWNFPGSVWRIRLMVACQLFIQAQNLVRKTKQILQSVLQLFPFWVSLLRWILRGEPLPCPLMQGHIRLDSCLCMTEAAAAARHSKNEKYMNIKSKIVLGVFLYLWLLNEMYMCIALAGFAYINDTWLDSRLTLFFLCFTETAALFLNILPSTQELADRWLANNTPQLWLFISSPHTHLLHSTMCVDTSWT